MNVLKALLNLVLKFSFLLSSLPLTIEVRCLFRSFEQFFQSPFEPLFQVVKPRVYIVSDYQVRYVKLLCDECKLTLYEQPLNYFPTL